MSKTYRLANLSTVIIILIWFKLVVIGCSEQKVDQDSPSQSSDSTALTTMSSDFDKVITLVADVWLPYNGYPDSVSPGFMIEIAKYAFEKAGYQVEYVNVPWARAIKETRKGNYDGIVGTGHDETPDFIFPEYEMGLSQHTFYVNENSKWRFDGIESLKQVTLGVIQDYSYGTLFLDYIKPNENDPERVQIVSGDEALQKNIRKLLTERIDVLVEDRSVLQYYYSKNNIENNFKIAGVYCDEKIFIAFSPKIDKAQDYADILSQAMMELRTSGKLELILDKYGVQDWAK